MSQQSGKYRLVTRSDFDGLMSAALLKKVGLINEVQFVHPKDMQDGKVKITANDITTNLPYVECCYMAFDHHSSEETRTGGGEKASNYINEADAPSAARVVYSYYGGKEKFGSNFDEIMKAVDRSDSAQYAIKDILEPNGWELLSYLMDPRTGLGRFRHFRISNYQLMMELSDHFQNKSLNEIMALPDIKERLDIYFSHQEQFKEQVKKRTVIHKNLAVLDLRNEEIVHPGNRFMIYALFPECNISIHALWGKQKMNTVFAVGKSIVNRTSKTNIGELMLKYGGGGHRNAGTCQIDTDKADQALKELIEQITNG